MGSDLQDDRLLFELLLSLLVFVGHRHLRIYPSSWRGVRLMASAEKVGRRDLLQWTRIPITEGSKSSFVGRGCQICSRSRTIDDGATLQYKGDGDGIKAD